VRPYAPAAIELVPAAFTPADVVHQLEDQAKQLTSQAADRIGRSGLTVETAVRQGDPRTVIVDEAAEWGANLIVMGSHGRTGLKRFLLGSVAQAVVGHAPCSVEVVRHPQAKSA
jgi:nucleotide-binding universal stress UspA family protein